MPDVVRGHETDAGTFGHEPAVGHLVVGAQAELLPRDRETHGGEAARHGLVTVQADQTVPQEVGRLAWGTGHGQIVEVGGGDDRYLAELSGDQRALHRPHHAHGDVGLSTQQIGERVGGDELDLDARLFGLEAHQHRRYEPDRRHVAGAKSHRAGGQVARLCDASGERVGTVLHVARRVGDRKRGGGRRHASAGALEQRRA